MEIRENDKVCIIAPICSKLEKRKALKIVEKIKQESRQVAIDLAYVQDCTIDFIESLKTLADNSIGIFNISAEIFVLFNMMNLDKSVKLFVSQMDFEEDSRQLINRNFKII